ncbi:hypothetical protein [Campylobacter gastrosuis]|uniref:Uncharacterized protein n=1 Tax=Campylobacter gastrosuis TaxID=2974576 RepID=A0ABT7HQ77_9BACT|nr:hypothetical protein [Campylobacter gastrosuis]MDL0088583.1 hypothetical protein [Campylobacter gastrosuis]
MRLGEFYSVLAMIFAKNFNDTLTNEDFEKIKKSKGWVVKNESENNKNGAKFYDDFLQNEILAELRTDFRAIKERFRAGFYFQSASDDLQKFYKSINFNPKMGEVDSISNQLLLIATILKNELDETHQKLLVSFLTGFFLPYAVPLSLDLMQISKSSFYKSMGYFLAEFCQNLQEIFKIKKG